MFRLTLFAFLFAGFAGSAFADRFGAKADPEFGQSIDFSYSYGLNFARDAEFWGPSLSYAQSVDERWGFSISLAVDQETENRNDGTRKTVHTFTGIGTVYYLLTDRVSVSTGFGKGFANDDNGHLKFSNGDWGTGGAASLTLYQKGDLALNLSNSLEYNISQREWSMSWDLGFSVSF